MLKCDYCGENAVDDTGYEEVCHSCGVVSQERKCSASEYVPTSARVFVPYTNFEARIRKSKRNSAGSVYGLNVLDQLCHVNTITADKKKDMVELFNRVSEKRKYRHRENAGIMAACCFFLEQRKNNQPITIKTLCSQIHCTRGNFSYFLRLLKSYLSNNAKEQSSPDDSVPSVSMNKEENSERDLSYTLTSLIKEVCEKVETEEKTKLTKKVTALVKLVDDCWLLTGRSPNSVVVACTYLCWKSMHRLRRKASFSKFCSELDIHEPLARRRLPELRAFLLKLAKEIPFYRENMVTNDNLIFHLDTILENSVSLRNDLLPDTHESEAISCKEYSNFRFPPLTRPRKEPLSAVEYNSDMNASDIEISDTEISSYVHSNTKQKFIELCKKVETES